MSRALTALEEFQKLSEAMTGAAEAQEWETLARLGEERGTLLTDLPADLDTHLAPAEKARARTIIEHCQQKDAQTLSRVEERQKMIGVLLRKPTPVT